MASRISAAPSRKRIKIGLSVPSARRSENHEAFGALGTSSQRFAGKIEADRKFAKTPYFMASRIALFGHFIFSKNIFVPAQRRIIFVVVTDSLFHTVA